MNAFELDKVRVFVSSTIRECAEERKVAKSAIESLNHIPLLFEDFGARVHGPRDMYIRGIEESHIFIAIYKESRGWISGDMEVSGIEDEFRLASRRGMPRLVYMKEGSGTPPPWIGQLADIMERESVTVHFYKDASDLFERIRNDVEAVIAEVFFGRTQVELLSLRSPGELLASRLPSPGKSLRRQKTEQNLLDELSTHHKVLVHGPMGIGKTILMAQFAEANKFLFLPATELTDKEVIGTAARILRGQSGQQVTRYLDLGSASDGFVAAWHKASGFTLVVDDIDDPGLIVGLMNRAGGASPDKRLVISTKATSAISGLHSFELPPLTPNEIETFVNLYRPGAISPAELLEIVERSRGNPLYLRYAVFGRSGHHPSSIEDYEKDHFLRLKPEPKELVRYVALADRPLPLGMLKTLLGGADKSVEELATHLAAARHLLQEERRGYTVVHEHLRQTLRTLLQQNRSVHAYYASKLSDQLASEGDYVGAYLILDRAEDPKARRLASKAAYQAQIAGDVKASIHILKNRLKDATESEDLEAQLVTLLGLSQVQTFSGDKEGASQSLAAATPVASKLKDESASLFLEEQRALMDARTTVSTASIEVLERIRKEHEHRGNDWAVARLTVDMSELYVRLGRHKDAAREAEKALAYFESIQDTHGEAVAKLNLAGALSMLPGEDDRTARLFREVRNEIDERGHEREQAWISNVLSIKARRAGNPETAFSYAEKAIQFGDRIGDLHIVTINRIAAGNALKDAERWGEAIAHYELAARTAQQSGFRELESAANELIASVYNIQGEHAKAEHFARYAAGLLRGTAATHTFARAMEELGLALLGRRESEPGAHAYLEAARALRNNENYKEYFLELAIDGLHAIASMKDPLKYIKYMDECFSLETPRPKDVTEALFYRVPGLLNAVDRSHTLPLLGLHFHTLFQDAPPPLAKFLLRKIIDVMLTARGKHHGGTNSLLALIPLLAAVRTNSLTMSDVVYIGDQISRAFPVFSFKPHSDGAAHWVVRLDFSTPVTCSIQQIDDRVETSLVVMFLALFLKGFEQEIQQSIILSPVLPQNEIAITVISLSEHKQLISESTDIPDGLPCVVTRPTNPKDPSRVPTHVIYRDDISSKWHAGQRRGSELQSLFGMTLLEIVYQLFEGAVDLKSIQPSIVSVVRRSIS